MSTSIGKHKIAARLTEAFKLKRPVPLHKGEVMEG
jgi:hypothetical protein